MTEPKKLTATEVAKQAGVDEKAAHNVMLHLIKDGWMMERFIDLNRHGMYDLEESSRGSGGTLFSYIIRNPSKHPEHGVSAKCAFWAKTRSGTSAVIWSDVVPGSAEYEITESDYYSAEICEGKELVSGCAFPSKEDADAWLMTEMVRRL